MRLVWGRGRSGSVTRGIRDRNIIYVYTCIHMYIYIYIYTYVCIYINAYVYICKYLYIMHMSAPTLHTNLLAFFSFSAFPVPYWSLDVEASYGPILHTCAYIHMDIYVAIHTYLYLCRPTYGCQNLQTCTHMYMNIYVIYIHIYIFMDLHAAMGWLQLVGSLKLQVSFAKEPYKRDDVLHKKPMISRNLLIVATPYQHLYTNI